ncbi:MAG: creatininase family protein [Candidatus Melainabacteria bacterium]|nr:creatininase family protein [Candidatus Melainabacteria bacterium]
MVLPTISASFYPSFCEHPGSISLTLATSAALISKTCAGLAAFGRRKIYVFNTGVSTLKVLAKVKEALALQNPQVKFSYTDFKKAGETAAAGLSTQSAGGHADAVETSIMLHLAPDVVTMANAAADFPGDKPGPLTRNPDVSNNSATVYLPSFCQKII